MLLEGREWEGIRGYRWGPGWDYRESRPEW